MANTGFYMVPNCVAPEQKGKKMTEQEMQKRIKEIDEERYRLRKEKEEYEQYLSEKWLKEQLENHKQYIGKCFASKNKQDNEHSEIKAFKILKILDSPNEECAECLALVDGYESNCWNVKAIKRQVIGLWLPGKLRLMNCKSDPKVIDFYKEISQEKFELMYKEYQRELDDILVL